MIDGEKLALKQAGNKVGKYTIKYVSLDDSTAQNPGTADEAQTASNARKAVQDKSTIFYLGEFNSGGTKVSLPILNKAGIPQISPSNTYVGLTTDKPGSEPGEPDKYYPAADAHLRARRAGGRHPGRRAGHDDEGGRLQVRPHLQRQDHVRRGPGPQHRAGRRGHRASRWRATTAPTATRPNYRSLAAKVNADCFVGSGVTGENYVQVFKDVAAANPTVKLYGPDGVAEEAFTNPAKGGIPADVGARTKITVATLGLEEFKKRNNAEAEKFFTDFEKEYGTSTAGPVRHLRLRDDGAGARHARGRWRQGQRPRGGATQLLENTKDRESALGVYSIDENGDTTLTDYGLYLIKDGLPTFEKVIKAQARLSA